MTRPFSNNLDKNNRVIDVISNRQGKVNVQPRESTRMTKVLFDGKSAAVYVDVMNLRLVLDGKQAEDLPPIDGEPPPLPADRPQAAPARTLIEGGDATAVLKAELEMNRQLMAALELQFKALRSKNDKLEQAIAILEGRPAA